MIIFAQQKFHIMAEKELYDSESMIMRARYAMSLIEDSWREGNLSDMEREDFKRQISELLQGMTALLDSNTKLGQELSEAREVKGLFILNCFCKNVTQWCIVGSDVVIFVKISTKQEN